MSKVGFSNRKIVFSGFGGKPTIGKEFMKGKELHNLFFHRDNDFGGFFCEINGLMGSGKTSLMLGMVDKMIRRVPYETLFWREPVRNPVQFVKLGSPQKYQVLSDRCYPLQVFEVKGSKMLPTDDIKIRYFDGVKNLMNKSKPGILNVVYFKELWKWSDLLLQLRYNTEWQSIYIDEMEDVCPQRCSNKDNDKSWSKNEELAKNIKEIRKNKVSLIYNTQSGSEDCDYRVRSKCMMHFYLYGSKYDSNSPISRKAFRSLPMGSARIDFGHSVWGRFKFKPYLPTDKQYIIVPEKNADIP